VSSLQALDTNYILALIDPHPAERNKARLAMDPAFEPVAPCIAYSQAWDELARQRPDRTAKKRKLFEEFIAPLRVLWLDQDTLRRFHDLCWVLARQNSPLQTNDVWIAALCLQHDALLITQNADFKNVPGLVVRSW
jgi:predicted nucleic acid-binding protein